ncbi:hypothetical protein RZS08_46500, partial [Arthrospira platensis SPKY1]|nr:hypothetical protein [Arthrospira platensis SPKY1]
IKQATSTEVGTFLAQVADRPGHPREKIDHLFLAGLGRRSTSQETAIAGKLYAARQTDMKATLQDLWWAILNSNEFIFVH